MLELKFRCNECGFETANPTQMHVCGHCQMRVCADCREAHEHRHSAPPAAPTSP